MTTAPETYIAIGNLRIPAGSAAIAAAILIAAWMGRRQ